MVFPSSRRVELRTIRRNRRGTRRLKIIDNRKSEVENISSFDFRKIKYLGSYSRITVPYFRLRDINRLFVFRLSLGSRHFLGRSTPVRHLGRLHAPVRIVAEVGEGLCSSSSFTARDRMTHVPCFKLISSALSFIVHEIK